jgi:hypothetical protein
VSSLFQKTAQLPEVPLELPQSAVGKNTAHAIQSGILLGYVGLVRHLLAEIRVELGEHYIAIATGGLSSILHSLAPRFSRHRTPPHPGRPPGDRGSGSRQGKLLIGEASPIQPSGPFLPLCLKTHNYLR